MWHRLSSSWSSDRSARPILLLVLVVALSLPGVTTRLYAADEVEAFSFLRSLWFDHDVSFDNEYRHFVDSGAITDPGFQKTFLDFTTETGLRRNFSTIGCALLWSPFYAVADAGVRVARALGSTVEADGYSRPYVAAVCYGSTIYGLLALVLSYLVARRLLRMMGLDARQDAGAAAWAAAAATWAAWLGTPLLFYMYVAPPYTHAVSAFVAAVFVWLWLRVRGRWSAAGCAMLGTTAAVMAMVREQDAFLAIGVVIDIAWTLVRDRRWRVWPWLAGAAAFGLVFLPQALAYLSLNGRIGPSHLVARKMTWTAPHALQVLLSAEHGLFWWTPLAALAAVGLFLMVVRGSRLADPGGRNDARRVGVCLIAMAAAQVYVAGAVESWTVAGAFGQRRFVVLTVLIVAGLGVLAAHARTRAARAAVVAALVLGVWWNIGLMVQFGAGWMDRQHLDLPQNAYNTFVTVPRRLPEIAYRYVFDRQSFYKASQPPGGAR